MDVDKLTTLAARTRNLLLDEAIPYAPNQIYAGPEHDHDLCAICQERLTEGEIAYEIDIETDGEPQTIYLHPQCHSIWHTESERLRREPRADLQHEGQ